MTRSYRGTVLASVSVYSNYSNCFRMADFLRGASTNPANREGPQSSRLSNTKALGTVPDTLRTTAIADASHGCSEFLFISGCCSVAGLLWLFWAASVAVGAHMSSVRSLCLEGAYQTHRRLELYGYVAFHLSQHLNFSAWEAMTTYRDGSLLFPLFYPLPFPLPLEDIGGQPDPQCIEVCENTQILRLNSSRRMNSKHRPVPHHPSPWKTTTEPHFLPLHD